MILSILLVLAAIIVAAIFICIAITAFVAYRVEAALPPIGEVIDIDGAEIRYLDQGLGPAIVLIHGLAGQMRHWTYETVDRLTDDYRVIVVDRPGCGYSTMAPGASSRLSAQAKTIAGLVGALKLDRPLIVGHSLGGAVALALALDHRESIGGLALISPLTHLTEAVPKVFSALATQSALRRWLMAWTVVTPVSLLKGKVAVALVFGPDQVKPDFAIKGGNVLTLRPSSFMGSSAELCAVPEDLPTMATRYASLDCPVGILFGSSDQILDPAVQGESLASKVPGATIEYIQGAGHMPPQVWPDRTNAFIRGMAQRISR